MLIRDVAVGERAFVGAQLGLLLLGIQEAMAQPELAATGGGEISVGKGLALIGIGIPTAISTVAAGMAVGPIGSASLAVLAEMARAAQEALQVAAARRVAPWPGRGPWLARPKPTMPR